MVITEKVSSFVAAITKKFKFILIGVAVYFAVLITYDLLFFKRGMQEMMTTYLPLLLISVVVWFGVRLVYYVQIKNSRCSKRFYNVLVIVPLVAFGIYTVISGVNFFLNGFSDATIMTPIFLLSILRAQFVRKK